MYTTVEGLLTATRDKLADSDAISNEATDGAGAGSSGKKGRLQEFLDKLDQVISGTVPFTLRLTDPMANTWIYSPTAPNPDPRMDHEDYTRTYDEDLDLGILDMKTEGYEIPSDDEAEKAKKDGEKDKKEEETAAAATGAATTEGAAESR